MHRQLFVLVGAFLACGAARAQIVDSYNPPSGTCCLPSVAKSLTDALLDWNQLGRYHADNEVLKNQPADPKRIVFLGDSITDFWNLAQTFPGKHYVNRGISGQTTSQILVRLYPDVIDLKPVGVIILAGTNDIAQKTGPETLTMIQENLMAITELSQRHGIKVILCSATPVSDYTLMPVVGRGGSSVAPGARSAHRIQTVQRPPADIVRLNAWVKSYAASVNAIYVDYYSAVVDSAGMFKAGLSDDGLHPNVRGYALIAPLAEAAIEKALK